MIFLKVGGEPPNEHTKFSTRQIFRNLVNLGFSEKTIRPFKPHGMKRWSETVQHKNSVVTAFVFQVTDLLFPLKYNHSATFVSCCKKITRVIKFNCWNNISCKQNRNKTALSCVKQIKMFQDSNTKQNYNLYLFNSTTSWFTSLVSRTEVMFRRLTNHFLISHSFKLLRTFNARRGDTWFYNPKRALYLPTVNAARAPSSGAALPRAEPPAREQLQLAGPPGVPLGPNLPHNRHRPQ